ncbi:MAG TPA: hypothetical protein PKA80_14175 [Ignavibacteriaceae bacterium]|nr:hypothetical protein [Ignavibacteriaceae bacterium]
MKTLQTLFLLFFLFTIYSLNIYSQTVELFPESKIYQKYYADALVHQFSLSKHFETNEWFGNIGLEKPLADLKFDQNIYQFTVAATVFNTLKITPPHIQVFTADYLVDFFLDKNFFDDFILRLNWGHLSAHFSDDGIIQLNKKSINYVRDYLAIQAEKLMTDFNGKIYLNATYNFHNEPKKTKHTHFQFGFDAGKYLSDKILFYFAFDFKLKEEVNFGSTKSFQLGIKYPQDEISFIRIAYTFRTGFEERGQLYNESNSKHLLGLFFDF